MEKLNLLEGGGSNIVIAENLIKNTFSFLVDEGYDVKCEPTDSNVFNESIKAVFINKTKYREIGISYASFTIDGNQKYSFSMSIIRLPYKDVDDFFSYYTYMCDTGKQFETVMVNVFDENVARIIVEKIANTLMTELWDVVVGRKWIKGYYPKW